MIKRIEQFLNKQNSKIVFVGDLVDKGKNTHDFIEFVKNNNYDCVLGNHDEMMILYHSYLENDIYHEDLWYWLFKCGGEATLNSYFSEEKFYEHIKYLKSLPHYIEYEDYKTEDNRYLVISSLSWFSHLLHLTKWLNSLISFLFVLFLKFHTFPTVI